MNCIRKAIVGRATYGTLTSFDTGLAFFWNFRTDLRKNSLAIAMNDTRQFIDFYRPYLIRLTARRPAPVTMMVCGEPFVLEDHSNFFGSSQNASMNSARFSMVLGFSHEVVSLIVFAFRFTLVSPHSCHNIGESQLLPDM